MSEDMIAVVLVAQMGSVDGGKGSRVGKRAFISNAESCRGSDRSNGFLIRALQRAKKPI